ncbi:hypothetical protein ACFSHT_06110 [Paraburkholderia silviterrae]|uniref:Core-binding (CB) domain-containing protein n=1 Tax=Paraburkholderia silviterrae TaxID=2528715 RepID=A0A4V2ZZA3_9BURK|nr:hypothetical protein [Paraburkholderia silviterrae]TDG24481.1 hypothetical protein EYW47_07905 [Paraburkholderia silviterrae]
MEKNVARLPYLHKPRDRNGWTFRVGIPQRLRPYANDLREFKRTLGPSFQEALRRYPSIAHEWAQWRATLEHQASAADLPQVIADHPPVTYKALSAREHRLLNYLVDGWEHRSLDAHDMDVQTMTDDELTDHERDLKERQTDLQAGLRRMTAPDWWVEEVEEHLAVTLGIRLHPDCPDRRDFFLRMVGAELKALKLSLERLAGAAYHATPPRPAEPLDDEQSVSVGPTLLDAYRIWSNLRTRSGGTKTVNEYRAYAESFAQFALQAPLDRASLAAITTQTGIGRRWLEHIASERGVQRPTLKKYRSALSTLFTVAIERELASHNPFSFRLDGLQLRGTQAEEQKSNKKKRNPLPQPVIDQYFAGPLFAGPGFDRRLAPAVAYWLPLLLRFTGARPLEIAYLMPEDIVLSDDKAVAHEAGHGGASWIYIFADERGVDGITRPVKTGVSLRRFPVPRILLDLGFADYVRSVPRGQWLLPMLVSSASPENRARYALNALGDYLRTTLEIVDPQLVTYSFRHTFIDEAREARIPTEVRDNLVGHAEGDNRAKNAGEAFYGAHWYPAKPLLEAAAQLGAIHRLPPNFPTWAEFQRRRPDFSNIKRASKALPSQRGRSASP